MTDLFVKIFEMSITASWIVLAVVLVRFIFKKAPKYLICLLWILVGIRLVVPFSVKSSLSLIPQMDSFVQSLPASSGSDFDGYFYSVSPEYLERHEPIEIDPDYVFEYPLQNIPEKTFDFYSAFISAASVVWVIGIAALLIYALVSWLKLRRTVSESVSIGNGVFICDRIDSPFILGVFSPKIYLPSSLEKNISEYVISHEKAHLKRLDHLWKPLGFLILTVYWFNPIFWLAYILLCRDIELACDESVIKNMSVEDKKNYSAALLSCSIHRKRIAACPVAFGEVGVKERIVNVLNYRKPAFWVIILAVVSCVVLMICFLTDPNENEDSEMLVGSNYDATEALIGEDDDLLKISVTADFRLYSLDGGNWNDMGVLKKANISNTEIMDCLSESIQIKEVADSYYLYYGNAYYLIFKTVNGEVFLCRGLSPNDITELYKLESQLGKRGEEYIYDSDFFNRSLRIAADINVSVFHYAFREDFLVVGFVSGDDTYSEFQTDMGYAVFTMHEDGYVLKEWHVYDRAALVTGGIFVCPDPAVLSTDGKMTDENTYDVVLSSNSNLASIERSVKISKSETNKITVPVTGQRSMTLFRWADDKTTAESSVSMRFFDSDGEEIHWNNILPEDISDISEELRAYSGRSNCMVYAFETGTPLENIKNSVNWLKLAMDEETMTPFDVYCGNREIYGMYYLYDAETLEAVPFTRPSGLEPQTFILQNTIRGKEYLVLFRANPYGTGADETLYAFGITLPELEEVTDPFAESDSPITWLKNITVADIYSVRAQIGGGDEFEFGIRLIRSLVETLNAVPDHSVYIGRGVPYKTVLTFTCGSRTYKLGYGGGLVEISFDSKTKSLYPNGIWQINDPNLAAWFENLEKNGVNAAGENDPLDFAEDFIRKFYSFYGKDTVPEMDFSEYTEIETLAEAFEYIRNEKATSKFLNHYTFDSIVCTASYLEGSYEERLYVRVRYSFDYHSGSGGGRSFYSFDLALKQTDNGFLITDFRDITDDFRYPDDQVYRYGTFGYFPIDDWEKNGEKYLSVIKGEDELVPEIELGKQLLSEFEANIDNYKEKYEIVSVEDIVDSYDGYYMKTVSEVISLCNQLSAQSEYNGVILMFNTGRYVAVVNGFIFDPLILDGTIVENENYWDSELHRSIEYFNLGAHCNIEDSQYLIVLD